MILYFVCIGYTYIFRHQKSRTVNFIWTSYLFRPLVRLRIKYISSQKFSIEENVHRESFKFYYFKEITFNFFLKFKEMILYD